MVKHWDGYSRGGFAPKSIENPGKSEKQRFFSSYGLMLHQAETECSKNCVRESLVAQETTAIIPSVVTASPDR